jgi:hypothetical protein
MPSIIKKSSNCKHQWMSISTDGSCIKCVNCSEFRMIDHSDDTKTVSFK